MNKKTIYLLLLLLYDFSGFSQTALRGPHGGNMTSSSGYKIELVACSQNFEVYLYDDVMQSILNTGIEGAITYQFKNEPEVTVKFHHWGIDGFSAASVDGFISCKLVLLINGRPIVATYTNNFICEQ